MDVNVLGCLEILGDGGLATPVRGKRNKQVLSLLTLHVGSVVPDTTMFDAMWTDDLPTDPGSAIRTYISRVRRLIAPSTVTRTPGGYRLDLDPASIDAWRFQSLATLGVAQVRSGERSTALDNLERAHNLWHGDPWSSLSHVTSVEAERQRLHELHLQTEEHLGAALLIMGQTDQAVRYLIGLTKEEPLRELRWSLLMRAHQSERNSAEALRAYQSARMVFIDQLGIEPGAELRSMELAILRGDPLKPAFAPPTGTSSIWVRGTEKSAAPIIERNEKSATANLDAAKSLMGGAPLVTITGEAGIGKTTLLNQLVEGIEFPTLVLRTQCYQAEAIGALRPIVDLLDQLQVADFAGDASDTKPDPVSRFRATKDDDSKQLLLFESLSKHLKEHADTRPILIVIDDLHWADSATLKALAHTIRHRGSSPIGVVVAYRGDEVRHQMPFTLLLDTSQRSGGIRVHHLDGLGTDDVARLLNRLKGPVDDAELDRVMALTNGNPFLVTELAGSAGIVSSEPALDGIKMLIDRQLHDLDSDTLDVLYDIVLCSGKATLTLLERDAGIPADNVLVSLEMLIDRRLVAEGSTFPDPEYEMTHSIFEQVIVQNLSAARRVGIHHRLALASDALEIRHGDRWTAESAYQWHAAGRIGDPKRCYESNLASAELAYEHTAYDDARISFCRAHDALGWMATPLLDGGRLHLRIAESSHRLGDIARAREAAREAADEAIVEGDMDMLASAALIHAGHRSSYGIIDIDTTDILHRAAAALAGAHRPDLAALVDSRLAQEIHHQGDHVDGVELAEAAVDQARSLDDPATLARVNLSVAWALNHPDHYDRRVGVIEEMVASAIQSDDPELELMSRIWRSAQLLEAGQTDELDDEMERLNALSEIAPVPARLVQLATLRAARTLMSGDFDKGMSLAADAHTLSLQYEPAMAEHVYRAQVLAPLREQGLLASILPLVEEMVRSFPNTASWQCAHAFVASEVGDQSTASRVVTSIVETDLATIPRDLTWSQSVAMLCEAALNCELTETVGCLTQQLLPFSGRSLPLWIITSGGAVDHYLGRLAMLDGDISTAINYLEKALTFHQRAGALPMVRRTESELNRARQAGGHEPTVGSSDLTDTAAI